MSGTNARGRATREALLQAARDLFAEIGYARTTHADIAAEAGIGRTTFYEHFTSKEDLLVQLVAEDLPGLIEELVAAVEPELAPDVKMRQLVARSVEFVGTDHLGLILHTEVPRLSLEAQAAIAVTHRRLGDELMGIYREGVEEGVFRELPGPLAGRLIEATIMTGGRVAMDLEDPKAEVHEVAGLTAEFLVEALRA